MLDPSSLHSLTSLRRLIPSSDAQLHSALHSLFAFTIDGHVRLLTPSYQHSLITDILNAITETGQSPLSVDPTPLTDLLAPLHPPPLIQQALHLLSPYPSSGTPHTLCPRILTRAHATYLLSTSPSLSLPHSTFIPSLTAYLPSPLVFDPADLLGLALSKGGEGGGVGGAGEGGVRMWHWLPVWKLAGDVRGRFIDLFGERERWGFEEIKGWTEDVCGVGEKVEGLLLKHARAVQGVNAHGKCTMYSKRG